MYFSHHVTFDEHLFPLKNTPPHPLEVAFATSYASLASPPPVPLVHIAYLDGPYLMPFARVTPTALTPISNPDMSSASLINSFSITESPLPVVSPPLR